MANPTAKVPSRRSRRRSDEILSRTVAVSEYRASLSVRAVTSRGMEPEIEGGPWLEVRGVLNEPLREASDVAINVYPTEKVEIGTARPAAVGSVIQVRPHIELVAALTHAEFDRVWAMALAGVLKHAYFACTKPHYNRALVTNLSFSNEPEE